MEVYSYNGLVGSPLLVQIPHMSTAGNIASKVSFTELPEIGSLITLTQSTKSTKNISKNGVR
jgi:hypothetical protein